MPAADTAAAPAELSDAEGIEMIAEEGLDSPCKS
jgi:hypothetical protein